MFIGRESTVDVRREELTPMYEAMNLRVSNGRSKNGPTPLNKTRMMHATRP
jgi:hypothetical protein